MGRHRYCCWLCGAKLIALLAALVATGGFAPTADETAVSWQIIPSPNLGQINTAISTVVAISKTEAWAAGTGTFDQWNGRIWNVFHGASLAPGHTFQVNGLARVPGTSPAQVWAVGYDTRTGRQMVQLWNGTAWMLVPHPRLSSGSRLNGVASLSTTDAWAVGSDGSGALIEHWNGFVWSVSKPATALNTVNLEGVGIDSATDVWTVGSCSTSLDCTSNGTSRRHAPTLDKTVIEHWNGGHWVIARSPSISGDLNGIGVRSSTDVWAVGDVNNPIDSTYGTLAEHWDGTQWKRVPSRNPQATTKFQTLQGVTARGSAVWAAGYFSVDGMSRAIIERWSGTAWILIHENTPPNAIDSFAGISGTPGGGPVWAAGGHIEEWKAANWVYTPAFNAGTDNSLQSLISVPNSGGEIWAVGDYVRTTGSGPLIERLNANELGWTAFTGANMSNGSLVSVDSVGPHNTWAVGTLHQPNNVARGAIEHWNGRQWTLQPNPPAHNEWWENLNSVSAIGPNNAWVAGNWYGSSGDETLVKHWNGSSWSVVKTPIPPKGHTRTFAAIDAVGPTNVWAVGYEQLSSSGTKTLIEHWNGTKWSMVQSPNPSTDSNELNDIAAISPTDIWSVGQSVTAGKAATLTEHWNGTTWSTVPSPSPSSLDDSLQSVSAMAANDVWAAGESATPQGQRALVEHWNGSSWSIKSPTSAPNGALLTGTSGGAAGQVWVVGSCANGAGVERTLTERGNVAS